MQVIDGILYYSDFDIKNIPDGKNLEDFYPKKKYYAVRKLEDSFHALSYRNEAGEKVIKKFQNQPGIMNRHDKRYRERNNLRMKTYKLDRKHKVLAKRRAKEKNRRIANRK